ncbi:retropepsin-like aspartic protease [Brevundimonas diminuta]|uniref:retropepsin-like aspartic protease n=1 Tax=Brevundimonas diminuta TaxID=293 RepID=UPI0022AE7184|nr:retropepsin-like aspartic protease [Brevundimonas diminuta]MCZ4108773.1 retropepsin-like aspartic protease [Brevundimonas diminuta]
MNRRTLLIRAGAAAAAVGGGLWLKDHVLWRRPSVTFGADGTSGWLGFVAPRTLLPTVRVRLAGRELTALIDSGAQYSVIDRRLVAELGLDDLFDMPLIAYGVDGRPQMGRGVTLDLAVGTARVGRLRAGILDLGPLGGDEGLGAPLILGQDLLMEAALEMDLRRRRLRLLDEARTALAPAYRPLPVRRSGTALVVEVVVEGAPVRAVVDTGSSSLLALSDEAARTAGLLDGRPEQLGSSIVLGGVARTRMVRAQSVALGGEAWRNVATAVYAGRALPNYPEALLGMEAFAGRNVILNLGDGRLHLAPLMDVTIV